MPRRASKRTVLDELEATNSLAASIVAQATGQEPKFHANPFAFVPESPKQFAPKNSAAVALGRLGASKGGKARAAALTKKRRKEIAKRAASARWIKKKSD
jgi:hypothetical protein